MNPRHAAALALVGWYLMLPPHGSSGGVTALGVWTDAPMSKWEIDQSFDTADECEQERARIGLKALDLLKSAPKGYASLPLQYEGPRWNWAWAAERVASHCIASDDPRLKETK